MSLMFVLMPVIFFMGILAIAFEDKLGINKSVSALIMCLLLWTILLLDHTLSIDGHMFQTYLSHHGELAGASPLKQVQNYMANEINFHLGDVSKTLFFILSSMLLVYVVDRYGGFKSITAGLATTDKRKLLWKISIASFFFSALLDNLAAAIVIIAILKKLVPNRQDRLKYACMSIIACNAGGSWSPIGDVTTLLLWTNGRLTPVHQIAHVIIPALVNLLVPLLIATFWLFKKGAKLREPCENMHDCYETVIPDKDRKIIFWIGMAALMLIPVWQSLFQLPAFMGALGGVTFIWFYTEVMFRKKKILLKDPNIMRVDRLMHHTDLDTIFYFLGILMAVAALEVGGQLAVASQAVTTAIPNNSLLALLIGGVSSMLDNVALVAAVMGMFPSEGLAAASPFAMNGAFWTFLAYCAVTGGSLLIIGSATGVTVMGMEKISFGYYLKRFSILALLGYLAGAGCFYLLAL